MCYITCEGQYSTLMGHHLQLLICLRYKKYQDYDLSTFLYQSLQKMAKRVQGKLTNKEASLQHHGLIMFLYKQHFLKERDGIHAWEQFIKLFEEEDFNIEQENFKELRKLSKFMYGKQPNTFLNCYASHQESFIRGVLQSQQNQFLSLYWMYLIPRSIEKTLQLIPLNQQSDTANENLMGPLVEDFIE